MQAECLQLLDTSSQLFGQRSFAAAEQAVMRAQALVEVIMLHQPDDDEAASINATRRMLQDKLQACQQGLLQNPPQSTSGSQQSFQVLYTCFITCMCLACLCCDVVYYCSDFCWLC